LEDDGEKHFHFGKFRFDVQIRCKETCKAVFRQAPEKVHPTFGPSSKSETRGALPKQLILFETKVAQNMHEH